jgi:hypothetical protein
MATPKPRPLSSRANELFDSFQAQATNTWTLKKDKPLHPADTLRFYLFINYAHAHQPRLSPADVFEHLTAAGFRVRVAKRLTDTYHLGREILAARVHPWERRQK